ncbi:MAG TPA: hypothetical protein VMF09_04995 [Solirubrobacteraceae bacterium]|nr:hypothetical protein [Solirubrobacteraceae bacterium]
MSTTEQGDETPDDGIELPESARRFHELYAADLRRVEPVSDAQILAAIHRAEVHDEQEDASRADIAAHLGFVHNSGTTRRLRPQLDALRAAGQVRDVRRNGLDLLALTVAGRRAVEEAQSEGAVVLPESPQHRKWRHSRAMAGDRIDGFRDALRASLAEIVVLLDSPRASSDAWFGLGKRLDAECKRLGSATYCLFEWVEPGDAQADVDEVLGRRNVWGWDNQYGR